MNAHAPIHMQVNSPELRKQHDAHKERIARLGSVSRRVACRLSTNPEDAPDAHVRQRLELMSTDACSHVLVWRRMMRRPIDVDVLRLDTKLHPQIDAWQSIGQVRQVVDAVSDFYGIPHREILSQRRTAAVVRARQIAMYLAKTLTLRTLPEIGRVIGGRDHTTVLHGVRKIMRVMKTDPVMAAEIAQITERLAESKA